MGLKKYYLDMRTLVGNAISDFKESLNLNEHIIDVTKNQDSVYFKESETDGTGMIYQDGTRLYHDLGDNNNLFFGKNAGNLTSGGGGGFGSNIGIGSNTLQYLGAGQFNVGIGTNAVQGWGNPGAFGGNGNVGVGVQAVRNITSGSNNIGIGESSLYGGSGAVTGGDNVAVGSAAGYSVTSGSQNTYLGHNAGLSVSSGSGNVFIGHDAGKSVAGGTSNTLIIENTNDSATPLITGNFDTKTLTFNVTNLNLTGLPTSASGLASGDVWNNSGVLTIV